jgi:hypothetical protein
MIHREATTMEAGIEEMAAADANANPSAMTTRTESNLWRLATTTTTIALEARDVKMTAVGVDRTTAVTMEHAEMDIANRSGANANRGHPKVWVIRSLMKSADSTCSKGKMANYTRVIW